MNKFKFSQLKKPILIAEISANHNGSILHAKKLIKSAKINKAGLYMASSFEFKILEENVFC